MAARTLQVSMGTHWMSAAHIASDDFEVDMHLDSAGEALAQRCRGVPGGALWAWRRRGLFRANEDEGPEVL